MKRYRCLILYANGRYAGGSFADPDNARRWTDAIAKGRPDVVYACVIDHERAELIYATEFE